MTILEVFGSARDQFLLTFFVAGLCSVPCALLGCYLVLKRMSLLGDAINHGVLPGIVLSVLVSGQITSFYLLAGAMVFGLLTAVLSQTLHSVARVSEDASLGVVYTSFFAAGVLLVSGIEGHFDSDCIFLGNLEQAYLNIGHVVPVQLAGLALTLLFMGLFWKEMKLAIFNPEMATAMGFNSLLLHYLLIALVAGVTVSSFEAVGSIVVLAMLIVPAATASLLVDRLGHQFFVATAVALLSSFVGCAVSFWLDTNTAGMLAVVGGGFFALAVIFAPRHGILAKGLRQWSLTLRIAGEDILAALYRSRESGKPPTSLTQPEHGFSRWTERLALWRLQRRGLIMPLPPTWELTSAGQARAQEVVRAHRLWEKFLEENFELPLDHLHGPAAWMEHFLGPHLQEELADQLQQPHRDPHGKAIPPPV